MVELDVSQLLGNGRYAVHCPTEEQAIAFVDFLQKNYPDHTVSWSRGENNWDSYYDRTTYSPELNRAGGRLTYCDLDYFIDRKYTIVPFESLIRGSEMPDLDIDDFSALMCL